MPSLNSRSLARARAQSSSVNAAGRIPPITREVEIAASPERVWAALADAATIQRWLTCANVVFEARPGGRFSLFDGDAAGEVTRIVAPRLLEYTWTMAGWPEGAPPSRVRWELSPVAGGKRTRLRLTHDGFPDRATRDAHDEGWGPNFLDKLAAWLDD
jgi:uncharacterized protein YndB with AHSA1/START domain